LDWLLSRATGYVGVVPVMGGRFLTAEEPLRPVLTTLRDRGLLFVEPRGGARTPVAKLAGELRLPRVTVHREIDAEASREAIARQLEELEKIALEQGAAVGGASPYPITVDLIASWAGTLEDKGLALAPATAIGARQVPK
jgi:polysaccharide deacetylase 2 family uncharacterized protein YibQ